MPDELHTNVRVAVDHHIAPAAHAGLKRRYGARHRFAVIAKDNLSDTLVKLGEWQEAVRLKEEVLTESIEGLGPDHPNTLMVRRSLAAAYLEHGELHAARRIMIDLLASEERLKDPDAQATRVLLKRFDPDAPVKRHERQPNRRPHRER